MKGPLVLRPRLSEKVYALSEELNTYVFDVPASANVYEVATAIKRQYGGVEVAAVRLANARGKTQRSIKRGGRSVRHFKRSNIRKAYVTLKEGHNLPIFAAVEENNAKVAEKENK